MYDFLYLVIDSLIVQHGYAFINMKSTEGVVELYYEFTGKSGEILDLIKFVNLGMQQCKG